MKYQALQVRVLADVLFEENTGYTMLYFPPNNSTAMDNKLSFTATPLVSPTPTSPHILVIGGGVTGLITAGLAGRELAGDSSCYPIRGGLLRVVNDGANFPKVDAALSVAAGIGHFALAENEIVFIVPRSYRILLLGGISEPHEWKQDYSLDHPVIQRIKARCEGFLPGLKNAELDPEYPLSQGLRPFRKANVRVERELRERQSRSDTLDKSSVSRIIHSYGHGGAGWSLSFGCAADVLKLVQETLGGTLPSR